MMALSLQAPARLLRKEWIQVTRDALTLRFIILVPVMQLFLFGFAINTNPKNLPTGLLSVDHSKYERTIVAALQNSGYYDIRTLASEAEAERALAQGEVLFVIELPANFDRAVDRGDMPSVLIDADASDPSAIGNATAALATISTVLNRDLPPVMRSQPAKPGVPVRGPRPLQSRATHRAQHRAGADLHRADDVDALHDHAVDHQGARARHHGEPARHAGAAARGHARQDHAVRRHRLHPGADHPRRPRRCSSSCRCAARCRCSSSRSAFSSPAISRSASPSRRCRRTRCRRCSSPSSR